MLGEYDRYASTEEPPVLNVIAMPSGVEYIKVIGERFDYRIRFHLAYGCFGLGMRTDIRKELRFKNLETVLDRLELLGWTKGFELEYVFPVESAKDVHRRKANKEKSKRY